MPENRVIKPFESFFVSMMFVFSTMWGLYYYWSIGAGTITDNPLSSEASFSGFINIILNIVSWLSPFALVKAFLLGFLPSEMYTFLDLFILRPIGWIGALYTANFIISKIPTISGE